MGAGIDTERNVFRQFATSRGSDILGGKWQGCVVDEASDTTGRDRHKHTHVRRKAHSQGESELITRRLLLGMHFHLTSQLLASSTVLFKWLFFIFTFPVS